MNADIQKTYNKIVNYTKAFGWKHEDVEDFVQWLYEASIKRGVPFKATNLRNRVIDFKRHTHGDKKNAVTKTRQAILQACQVEPHHAITQFEDSDIYRFNRTLEHVGGMGVVPRAVVILARHWGLSIEEISFTLGVSAHEVEAHLEAK